MVDILLYKGSSLEIMDCLVSKLGVHVVGAQPGDDVNVGGTVPE